MRAIESGAGRTEQQPGGYLAFLPNSLPREALAFEDSTHAALADAASAIGELKGLASALPNPDLFLGMYVRKEALLSSEIENVESTLEDVLEYEDAPDGASKETAEVVHYVAALNTGIDRVRAGGQLSLALIQELHRILMQDEERDPDRDPPGRFRTRQNVVGRPGDTFSTAVYVPPPSGPEGATTPMFTSLVNLAYYMNEFQGHAPLVRCALAHAQFETIHPFADGNGRVGRMLIPLMLARDGLLDIPLLYPSLVLNDDKPNYYDRLMAVRERGDWNGWVGFFSGAIVSAAREAITLTKSVQGLQAEVAATRSGLTPTARRLSDLMFQQPVLTATAAKTRLGVAFGSANSGLRALEKAGWVTEIKGAKRNRTYQFTRYLDLLRAAGESEPVLKRGPKRAPVTTPQAAR
jgi:Fic family protein